MFERPCNFDHPLEMCERRVKERRRQTKLLISYVGRQLRAESEDATLAIQGKLVQLRALIGQEVWEANEEGDGSRESDSEGKES